MDKAIQYIRVGTAPSPRLTTVCIAGKRVGLLTMSAAIVLCFWPLTPPTRWNRMIRGLLLDLEGVLYESGHTIAGAADAVRELADAGLRIRYLTNTNHAIPSGDR